MLTQLFEALTDRQWANIVIGLVCAMSCAMLGLVLRWTIDRHSKPRLWPLAAAHYAVALLVICGAVAGFDSDYLACFTFVLALAATPVGLIVAAAGGKRYPSGCCHRCGYDLSGNVSGRCPECGTMIEQGN